MTRTKTDLDRIAAESETMLDNLDPRAIADADRLEDLRAIRAIVDELGEAESRLDHAVLAARRNGRSWGEIALVLGVTRQSAHAKYSARHVPAEPAPIR